MADTSNNNEKYKDKSIRFYDKEDHYELWFMDDFNPPSSGTWEGSKSYTLLTDIIEDLHSAVKTKELHIFIWSYGGEFESLIALLGEIAPFKRTVAVAMGACMSAAFFLFFSCNERYAQRATSFMYHEPWKFSVGHLKEIKMDAEHGKKLLLEMSPSFQFICTEVLRKDEVTLGETTEVYLTGGELIDRGVVLDYNKYRTRPKIELINNEFFKYDGNIYRFDKDGKTGILYVPSSDIKINTGKLGPYTQTTTESNDKSSIC